MGWTARLKPLDDRVLGKPKPPTLEGYRRGTLVGVVVSLALIGAFVVIRDASMLGGLVTMVGLTGLQALGWRRLHIAQRSPD